MTNRTCQHCGQPILDGIADRIAGLSRWVDEANADRDPEARTWGRVSKVAEECGEAIAALIAVTGQNPRKGPHGFFGDVSRELLDVAVTALAAYEHLDDNRGECMNALAQHVKFLDARRQP